MKVMFVCTGNICRSPMAEVILKNIAPKSWTVSSSGTHAMTGWKMTDLSEKSLKQLKFRVGKGTRARQWSNQMLHDYDHVVCMTDDHKETILSRLPAGEYPNLKTLNEWVGGGDIPDPYGLPLSVYLDCCLDLSQKLKELNEKINSGK